MLWQMEVETSTVESIREEKVHQLLILLLSGDLIHIQLYHIPIHLQSIINVFSLVLQKRSCEQDHIWIPCIKHIQPLSLPEIIVTHYISHHLYPHFTNIIHPLNILYHILGSLPDI